MIREWAPLWAIPVIPLGGERNVEKRVLAQYPGYLEQMTVVVLRRVDAALLIPRSRTHREAALPLPAALLNRRSSPRNGLFYAATSRGFDIYRLEQGKLREAWSTRDIPYDSRKLPQPGRLRGLTAADVARRSATQGNARGIYAATLVILVTAAAARIIVDRIPEPRGRVTPPLRASLPLRHPRFSFKELSTTLVELNDVIPAFRLRALELSREKCTVRFSTELPVPRVLQTIDEVIPSQWIRTADREEDRTQVRIEVRDE